MKDINNSKITTRQAIIIFILAISSPLITVTPILVSGSAKEASYIAPVFSLVLYLIIIYTLYEIFKKNEDLALDDIFKMVLGNVLGKILMFAYVVWLFTLLLLYVRSFGERFVSTISVSSPIQFFIATMIAVGFVVARGKLEHFARSTEAFLLILISAFLIAFLLILPEVELKNLYPVTTDSIIPMSMAAYQIASLCGYVTIVFFLGNQITDKKNIKKYGIQSGIFLAIATSMVMLITVGVFGYSLTKQFPLPFFMALKNVKLLGRISGLESIFVSFWLISDFVIIALLLYVINKLISRFFSLKPAKETITPIAFVAFICSLMFVDNSAEITEYIKRFETHISIIFGFVIPAIILVIGKLRKKL